MKQHMTDPVIARQVAEAELCLLWEKVQNTSHMPNILYKKKAYWCLIRSISILTLLENGGYLQPFFAIPAPHPRNFPIK